MFSGRIILNFGISERLRAFRYPIFTGGVVEKNSICSAAFCESAALQENLLPAFSRLNRYVTIFPLRPLCVKMRLEHSAECDKRKNKNNRTAIYAQSTAEGILNRFVCPQRLSAEKQQTAFSAPPPCNLCNCDKFSRKSFTFTVENRERRTGRKRAFIQNNFLSEIRKKPLAN